MQRNEYQRKSLPKTSKQKAVPSESSDDINCGMNSLLGMRSFRNSSENRRHSIGFMSPSLNVGKGTACNGESVDLMITNLDLNLGEKTVKNELRRLFRSNNIPYLDIVTMYALVDCKDGKNFNCYESDAENHCKHTLKALVRLQSPAVAQLAVLKLHKTKLGSKRIVMSRLRSDKLQPLNLLKTQVLALFDSMTSKELPLLAFQDHFEKRYHRSISMAEIHRLKDVIYIQTDTDRSGGRRLVLNENFIRKDAIRSELLQFYPFCRLHRKEQSLLSTEFTDGSQLPKVKMALKTLGPRIHTLLDSHHGLLPLNTFIDCYTSEFLEDFIQDETPSVPLEHLISCVAGVQIFTSPQTGFKEVKWVQGPLPDITGQSICLSPDPKNTLAEEDSIGKILNQFAREAKDLLKNQPECLLSFCKFIPAYHSHFGRQCCVFDYGYTKLIDLLEAVSDVVEILGEGTKRLLTLTHREQTKRFAVELQKVIRAQPEKKLRISEYATLFESTFGKPFNISNYGVCYLNDILNSIWEGTVEIIHEDDFVVVKLPTKVQTEEERYRTRMLAEDVVKLLQSVPSMSLPFSKFIPAYHHYFNRQCKVSDYGFSKLIDLLEELSMSVIEITGKNIDEKVIRLNEDFRVQTICERMEKLVHLMPHEEVTSSELIALYEKEFGSNLNNEDINCPSFASLIEKLSLKSKVTKEEEDEEEEEEEDFQKEECLHRLQHQILTLLMSSSEGRLRVPDIISILKEFYCHCLLTEDKLLEVSKYCFLVHSASNEISMTEKQMFLCASLRCMEYAGHDVTLSQFIYAFSAMYPSLRLDVKEVHLPHLIEFFQTCSDYVQISCTVSGRETEWILNLNDKFLKERKALLEKVKKLSQEAGRLGRSSPENVIEAPGYSNLKDQELHHNGIEVPPVPPSEWLKRTGALAQGERSTSTKPKPRRIAAKFDYMDRLSH